MPINVLMEVEVAHSYAVALQSFEGSSKQVGQRKPEGNSVQIVPMRQNQASYRYLGKLQNTMSTRHFGLKGDGVFNTVGQTQF